jgi:ankyrin repeat protein
VVQLLLQAGADVDARTAGDRDTSLHLSAFEGWHEVVQLLLQAGADVNATSTDDAITALHVAALAGRVEVVQLLLQAGADVEARASRASETPLHCAAWTGRVEASKLLLCHGADINVATGRGLQALTYALNKRHTPLVQLLLLNKGAAVSADILRYAAEHGAPEGVLLVVAALGPAADAAMLSNASKLAAVAGCTENAAVLLKQLCLVDPAAVEGVVRNLPQLAGVAAACVARWLAETRSMVEQQQRLDEQQRSIAAERLAVQQLLVAVAGTQQRVAAERQALEQRSSLLQHGDPAGACVDQFSGDGGATS